MGDYESFSFGAASLPQVQNCAPAPARLYCVREPAPQTAPGLSIAMGGIKVIYGTN
jgi:hypothetical protein